jgi:hypothetical protein
MFLLGFPLLLIPLAIYNIVEFIFVLSPAAWTAQAVAVPMASGEIWKMTWEDIFVALSILLLLVEVIKSTQILARGIMDHVLAMLLFVVILAEFLLARSAGTSTFFLLLVISLVDVLAGFIIGVRLAQRQVEVEGPVKT